MKILALIAVAITVIAIAIPFIRRAIRRLRGTRRAHRALQQLQMHRQRNGETRTYRSSRFHY